MSRSSQPSVEGAQRHRACRVELVRRRRIRCAAAAPRGGQVVALVRPAASAPAGVGLAERGLSSSGSCSAERATGARRSGRTCRERGRGVAAASGSAVAAPSQPLARSVARLKPTRDVPAALKSPEALLGEAPARRPRTSASIGPLHCQQALGQARRQRLPSRVRVDADHQQRPSRSSSGRARGRPARAGRTQMRGEARLLSSHTRTVSGTRRRHDADKSATDDTTANRSQPTPSRV